MDKKFSLSELHGVFIESLERNEPTIAFEFQNGKGKFLFMMFFDEDDNETKDLLFIFFRNTRRILKLKMYGNHLKGQFDVYIKPFMEMWFKEELLLSNTSSNSFVFSTFFSNLNMSIPHTLPLTGKMNALQNAWDEIKDDLPKDVIKDYDKLYLKHPMVLPKNKKPQEKTLRKLYLYNNGNPEDIVDLINMLKKMNTTLVWTNDENYKGKTIESIMREL